MNGAGAGDAAGPARRNPRQRASDGERHLLGLESRRLAWLQGGHYNRRVALRNMDFSPTTIPDVLLVRPKVFQDDRGFFVETYRADTFAAAGVRAAFVQDNHSGSHQTALRGLHYQVQHTQGKLVRIVAGEVFDVAVDLRRRSPTFGHWVGVHLTSENRHMLWVPPGFAHGFYTLSDWAEVVYKVTDVYAPEWERTLAWDDPAVGIAWPLIDGQPPTLSAKDAAGKRLPAAETFA